MSYNPNNWYWIVAGSTTLVFSSAAQAYVPVTDATYLAWRANNYPSQILNEAELIDVLAQQAPGVVLPSIAGLVGYALAKQETIAAGGITVAISTSAGIEASTDTAGLTLLNTAAAIAAVNPAATTPWVESDGTVITLSAEEVLTISSAVAAFIQATFATLATVVTAIKAGTITSKALVDTPPSGVPAWPANS